MLLQPWLAHATRAVLSAVGAARGRLGGRGLGLVGLLLALWLAPVLGQMHRALHAVPWRALPVQGAVDGAPPALNSGAMVHRSAAAVVGPASEAVVWLERLFSSHTSDADCLVFEQLAHEGPPQFAPWPLLAWPPLRFVAWWLDATLVATTAAPCQARAPPVVR